MSVLRAALIGGPSNFPENEREQVLSTLIDTIKKRFGSGYEHFRHSGEFRDVAGERVAVYEWVTRTRLAE